MKANVEKVLVRDEKLSELDDRAGRTSKFITFTKIQTSILKLFSQFFINYVLFLFSDALQQGASQFEQQAKSLKNKFWLQNLKVSR